MLWTDRAGELVEKTKRPAELINPTHAETGSRGLLYFF